MTSPLQKVGVTCWLGDSWNVAHCGHGGVLKVISVQCMHTDIVSGPVLRIIVRSP